MYPEHPGAPSCASAVAGQRMPPHTNAYDRIPGSANIGQEEDKEEDENKNKNEDKDENEDKEKDEENQASPAISPFIPLGETDMGFAEPLNSAFGDWLAYKQERRQTYKPKGLQNLYTQVCHAAERYGNAAVADCIRDSMACNYQGILFDRLKKTRKGQGSADNPFLEMLREAEGDHESF